MRFALILAAGVLAASTAPAFAGEATVTTASATSLSVRTGMLVFTADGRRVGRIDSLVGGNQSPTAVKIIKDAKMVVIPVATLSAGDRPARLTTSMAYNDIR